MNSLKHGFRIETLALPGEDGAILRGELDRWNDFYQPTSPGEKALIEQAVTARVQQIRALGYQTEHLTDTMRKAEKHWDERREDEVKTLTKLLESDSDTALCGLQRSAQGCRFLIGRWEHLEARLVRDGGWNARERDEAIRLRGLRPEPERLNESADAAEIHRYCEPILIDEPAVASQRKGDDARVLLKILELSAARRKAGLDDGFGLGARDRAECLPEGAEPCIAGSFASLIQTSSRSDVHCPLHSSC